MFNDLIHPAFVLSGSDVALDVSEVSGDNPITAGLQLSDRLRQVMTASNKLRIVISS